MKKALTEKSIRGTCRTICTLAFVLFLCGLQGTALAQERIKSPYHGAGPDERRMMNMTFDNLDIYPILEHVLGEILELNYVVDPAIKGTLSLRIQGSYTKDEFLELFNSILDMSGLAITRGGLDLYKVIRKPIGAKAGADVVAADEPLPHHGDLIQVIQLKYLAVPSVIANIKTFLSPGAMVVPATGINAILVVDSKENIEKVRKILSLMDTEVFKGIQWKLFTLEYTDAEDIAKDLDRIFKSKGLYARPGIDTEGLQLIPLRSINALLVITRWEDALDDIGHWISELDQGQSEKGERVYVYFVQNGLAKEITEILRQLYGAKKTSKTKKQVIVRKEKQKAVKAEKAVLTGELSGEVEIIADEVNNAVIIRARPKDYAIISAVLKQLDVVPRQVLINVLVVEVSLKGDISYGVEWFLKSKGIKIGGEPYNGDIALTDTDLGGIGENVALGASSLSGLSLGLFDPQGTLRALVKLLATTTDVNILSAPNILAVDNKESSIEITQDEPTVTSSTTSSEQTATTRSIQYRSVGIILKVTPSINESGLVRMEVAQEVSNVLGASKVEGIDSPIFQTRKATTNLVVQDGHTIVIGGLMKTQKEKSRTGIPLLKDVPLLGYFFGSTGFKKEKTELLFAITPRVIHSQEQADALTREFSEKVTALKQALDDESHTLQEEQAEMPD